MLWLVVTLVTVAQAGWTSIHEHAVLMTLRAWDSNEEIIELNGFPIVVLFVEVDALVEVVRLRFRRPTSSVDD